MQESPANLDIARTRAQLLRDANFVLNEWHVPMDKRPSLLGMGAMKTRDFAKVANGLRSSDDPNVIEIAAMIMTIRAATLKMFPHSEMSANLWVDVPQHIFGGKSVLELLHQYGLEGLKTVDAYLNGDIPMRSVEN
jgi:hypothetical protein